MKNLIEKYSVQSGADARLVPVLNAIDERLTALEKTVKDVLEDVAALAGDTEGDALPETAKPTQSGKAKTAAKKR